MSLLRIKLEEKYRELGNILENQYAHLSFGNHCYWRIAVDNTLNDRWDKHLKKPAYKNLSDQQLLSVINRLEAYSSDENYLLAENRKSLQYRNKTQKVKQPSLFD